MAPIARGTPRAARTIWLKPPELCSTVDVFTAGADFSVSATAATAVGVGVGIEADAATGFPAGIGSGVGAGVGTGVGSCAGSEVCCAADGATRVTKPDGAASAAGADVGVLPDVLRSCV